MTGGADEFDDISIQRFFCSKMQEFCILVNEEFTSLRELFKHVHIQSINIQSIEGKQIIYCTQRNLNNCFNNTRTLSAGG